MKSKELVIQHIAAKLSQGDFKQRHVAQALGINSPNFVSMLLSPEYPRTLLPLNRLQAFSEFCGLTPLQTVNLAVARIQDGEKGAVEMSKGTLLWLFKRFVLALMDYSSSKKDNHERN